MAADVLLAAVMGAQGLKGEVKVKTFTHQPDGLARYGVLHTRDGRNANDTTSQRETDLGHGPVFYDNLVEVTAVSVQD